jgi:serine O-acetyltransferase
VVLKAVPPGATVVGVPGHIITVDQRDEKTQQRQELTQKLFDAYGTTQDMPDPVEHAINCILDHLRATDHKLETISASLRHLDKSYTDNEKLPELANDMDSIEKTAEHATPKT